MSSAICFNLDQSKILLAGNGLSVIQHTGMWKADIIYMWPQQLKYSYKL